jgi:acetyl-CoA acetyltransferase
MRKAITLAEYEASNFVCEPLHLFDYCLINDGGVALIVASPEVAGRCAKTPVYIEGVGRADLNHGATSLEPRLLDFYLPAQQLAAAQVFGMAGCGPCDIDALQVYDSFSCHVLFALEGFGFCEPGKSMTFARERGLRFDGGLPVNTGGGHLSESYMQGWNHQIEAVRQLRKEGCDRQVKDCRRVMYVSDVAGKVVSLIYGVI